MTVADTTSFSPEAHRPVSEGSEDQSTVPEKYATQTTAYDYRTAVTSESERVARDSSKSLPDVKLTSVNPDKTAETLRLLLKAGESYRNSSLIGLNHTPSKDAVFALLKDKTAGERKEIAQAFQRKYDKSLESALKDTFDGHVLDGALGLLKRSDKSTGDAERIHTTLIERSQLFAGRSDKTCESDIIDTIATLNSKQIADLASEYRQKYGVTLEYDLLKRGALSKETGQALTIFLKGSDQITNQDRDKLATLAMDNKNLSLFQKVFRDAPDDYRREFIQKRTEAQIIAAFREESHHGLTFGEKPVFDREGHHALDYVRNGKLSVATEIKENTTWIGDNNKAIEKSLENMTDAERARFMRGKELSKSSISESTMNQKDVDSLAYFRTIDKAMQRAGTEAELHRWHDMVENKGGTLVSRLAEHRGWLGVFNDKTGKVIDTIENMSRADWTRLKQQPEFKQKVLDTLKTYLSDADVQRADSILDRKQGKKTFEESQISRRMIAEIIDDSKGQDHYGMRVGHDPRKIIESISSMPKAEQQNYRINESYRNKVDKLLNSCLNPGTERELAQTLLAKVARGEEPKLDIVDRLKLHKVSSSDESVVVRDLKETLASDPSLAQRLRAGMSGQGSEADRKLSRSFANAARDATSISTFFEIIKPLVLKGSFNLEKQVALSDHTFSTDRKGIYTDLTRLSQQEQNKLLTDKSYQEKVLAPLNKEERHLALNIVKQQEMRIEDKLRAALLTSEGQEVKQIVGNLSADEKMSLRLNYSNKYGELSLDIVDSLSGRDKQGALQSTRRDGSSRQEFNNARDDFYSSRAGLISRLVNDWDGTGYQADSTFNQYASLMSKYASAFRDLPAAEQAKIKEKLSGALDEFVNSKGEVTDALINTVLGAACFGGSLPMLVTAVALNAALKPVLKAHLLGEDHGYHMRDIVNDILSGAENGLLSWGIGNVVNWAMKAAKSAFKSVVAGLNQSIFITGGKEVFIERVDSLVKNGFQKGSLSKEELMTALKETTKLPEAQRIKVAEQIIRDFDAEFQALVKEGFKPVSSPAATTNKPVRPSETPSAKPAEKPSTKPVEKPETEPGILAAERPLTKEAAEAQIKKVVDHAFRSSNSNIQVASLAAALEPYLVNQSKDSIIEIEKMVVRELNKHVEDPRRMFRSLDLHPGTPEKAKLRELNFLSGVRYVEKTNGKLNAVHFDDGKAVVLKNGRWYEYSKMGKEFRLAREPLDGHFDINAENLVIQKSPTGTKLFLPDRVEQKLAARFFSTSDAVSPEIVSRYQKEFARFPDKVQAIFEKSGNTFSISRSLFEANELRGVPLITKRRMDAEGSFDMNGKILLAEKVRVRGSEPPVYENVADPERLLRKEVGRVIDDRLGNVTDSRTFRELFARDLEDLSKMKNLDLADEEVRKLLELRGHLNPSLKLSRDVFAEIFASMFKEGVADAGNTAIKLNGKHVYDHGFANLKALIRSKLANHHRGPGIAL